MSKKHKKKLQGPKKSPASKEPVQVAGVNGRSNSFIWSRWIRTPKPTEWVTAMATAITCLILWKSGLLDAKKSEIAAYNSKLEVSQIELKSNIRKLEADEHGLQQRIAQANADISFKQEKLDTTLAELAASKERLAQQLSNEYHLKPLTYLIETGDKKRPATSVFCNPTLDPKSDTFEIRLGVGGRSGTSQRTLAGPNTTKEADDIDPIVSPEKDKVFSVIPRLKGLHELYVNSVRLEGEDLAKISNLQSLRLLDELRPNGLIPRGICCTPESELCLPGR